MPRNFHQELRYQRKTRNETLQQVADAVDKDKRTVGRWEKDQVPKTDIIVKLNNHFNTDFFPLLTPGETVSYSVSLQDAMGDLFERFINMEAHMEVLQNEVAKIKAGPGANKPAVKKVIDQFEAMAKAAANMRFDELKRKP